MVQAFIFDIDGTLVDSVDFHARAWQQSFAHFGRNVPFEDIRAQIGKGGDQLMPVFLAGDDIRQFGSDLEKLKGEIYRREYLPHVRAFPRVRELLETLHHQGIRIALASSSNAAEVQAYKRLMDVNGLVDAETSADDAERTKPEPDIFAAALEKLGGVSALVVGDTPYDAQAARKIGLPVIGLLCGGFPERDLREAGCAVIYADPAGLLDRISEAPEELLRAA